MSGLQSLLETYANMEPDEVLIASLQEGVRMFCTTAGARTPVEEVSINPLPDQVNGNGSDPDETDSALEVDQEESYVGESGNESHLEDENGESLIEGDDEGASDDADDSEYEAAVERQMQTSSTHTWKKRSGRKRSKAATTRPQSKNEALATSIPAKARLPSCDIGIVELLSFFPNHTRWPEVGLRAYRNEWKHPDVARIQLHARGNLNRDAYEKRVDSLKHQILKNGRNFFKNPAFKPTTDNDLMTPVASYNASNYAPRNRQGLMDVSLVDIAEGVVNWPVGQDRGIVTQAIEYAYNNGLNQCTTADIPRIAQQMGFAAPSEAAGNSWDQNAKARVGQIARPVPAALP